MHPQPAPARADALHAGAAGPAHADAAAGVPAAAARLTAPVPRRPVCLPLPSPGGPPRSPPLRLQENTPGDIEADTMPGEVMAMLVRTVDPGRSEDDVRRSRLSTCPTARPPAGIRPLVLDSPERPAPLLRRRWRCWRWGWPAESRRPRRASARTNTSRSTRFVPSSTPTGRDTPTASRGRSRSRRKRRRSLIYDDAQTACIQLYVAVDVILFIQYIVNVIYAVHTQLTGYTVHPPRPQKRTRSQRWVYVALQPYICDSW